MTTSPPAAGSDRQADRRTVIVYVGEEYALEAFRAGIEWPERLPIRRIRMNRENGPHLPPDAKVERVWHEPGRRAFGLLLSHASFEPTPAGYWPAERVSEIYETTLARQPDGSYRAEE